jgi:hypothetical protein
MESLLRTAILGIPESNFQYASGILNSNPSFAGASRFLLSPSLRLAMIIWHQNRLREES